MATLVFSEAEMRDGWRARVARGKVRKVRLCLIEGFRATRNDLDSRSDATDRQTDTWKYALTST